MTQSVALVGGGHAHLEVVRQARRLVQAGGAVTLLDRGNFWYSGMATGMLAGDFEAEEDQIDLAALAQRHGARYLRERCVAIDRAARRLHLQSGRELHYDWVSFNVGSRTAALPEACEFASKPIHGLAELKDVLLQGRVRHLVVVGAGLSGTELAACAASLSQERGLGLRVSLVAADSVAPGLPAGARRRLESMLAARGVEIQRARAHTPPDSALCLNATGLEPTRLIAGLDLPSTQSGLLVEDTLRCAQDERVFAVGDCADIGGRGLPRVGVYGVRAAPILVRNLVACLTQGPLEAYRPQRRFLAILNLGLGQGLAVRGRWWWAGRSAWWLKRYIDTRFMARYRA